MSADDRSRIPSADERLVSPNFVTEIIDRDLRSGVHERVVTRFPPEPNGYLHIGHAKAIVLDFGVAVDYAGRVNLRMDDTNPTTEDVEYVEAIKRDIAWLGFEWDELTYASDYFEEFYRYAVRLVEQGKAYVDSLSEEEIREYRGTVSEPGRESPYRDRPVAESLDLLERMRRGEFREGEHVLRAKIDMSSRNMLMRDPLLYRIRHAHHYRTGDEWCIYPLYDYAHPLSDALEGITHSLCSLEFENNREVYDWVVANTVNGDAPPRQYEFARLRLDYTVLSKRKLIELVRSGAVAGWDDPRMPTIAGLRRRGVTPEAIRDFANRVGVTRADSRTDLALLEHSIRDDLNTRAPRVMAVLDPLKVVLTNHSGGMEELEAPYWPEDVPGEGSRPVPFGRELVIDRADFSEDPPKGWRRLAPGGAVRLRHAYVIRCDEVVRGADGSILELRCTYFPDSLGRNPEGVKPRGAIHWLDRNSALPAEFRLYDRLFTVPDPDARDEMREFLNPESLVVRQGLVEPSVAADPLDTRYQFERLGYFWRDPEERGAGLVFNRIVTLKDSWERQAAESERAGRRPAARRADREAAPARVDDVEAQQRRALASLSAEQRGVFDRLVGEWDLPPLDAVQLAAEERLSEFFHATVAAHPGNARGVANWILNEALPVLRDGEGGQLEPAALAELVKLQDEGVVSSAGAREAFAVLVEQGGDPRAIVAERGLEQVSDTAALEGIIDGLLGAHPAQVEAYRAGKTGLAGFFVGQVMKETRGRANPRLVKELVERKLG